MDRRCLFLSCLLGSVLAQSDSTDDGAISDPISQYRPVFARSLPVQLLLNGIVLTLMAVLLLQLLFTSQYHVRLAPVNFSLQISAVCTLLVSAISSIQVIFATLDQESKIWPYMLNYVAVEVPPDGGSDGWSTAEIAAWLLMTATTGMLIQITHIQFLTLLFPSKLERRLIFCLLFPLSVISAAMQMLRIRQEPHIERLAVYVQNICNAALSLLFTVSLLGWGLLLNRKNAWRTDGGTAAFGAGALLLAPMSTVISLVYIAKGDQLSWMKPLMWSVILWQSFLGWWWWVGAGMGVGELDELLSREEKKQQKRLRRSQRRRAQRQRAETLWKGVTGAFGINKGAPAAVAEDARSTQSGGTWRVVRGARSLVTFMRREHLAAARAQAAEWVERVNEVYGREREGGEGEGRGWSLGQYGTRRVLDVENETVVDSDGSGEADGDGDADGEVDKAEKGVEGVEGEEAEDGVHRVRRRNWRKENVDSRDARERRRREMEEHQQATSLWWWGPLRRWRLQDTTEY
ncbi:uncharacterized protein LAESUDRAFT_731139 [Laetiporus sulphureus 93-53]|uniref:Family A G protein-coupled receptor-like protein n=1 Tax=Laetiporus sulphureus 93-53 TaxID=1314785 RepID=A0A165BPV5_9APHY|nr:uncharacterized protein LAESUDRAFT_731139 [Laetiporus sulphureus 93-53]KZT01438.1 hypothetical protein LAESUDRAFT_731139 [Laetiporus sulphureus 93-53]